TMVLTGLGVDVNGNPWTGDHKHLWFLALLWTMPDALGPEDGGWGGIRTHGGVAATPVFKTGALNRSATHPNQSFQSVVRCHSGTRQELRPFWTQIGPVPNSIRWRPFAGCSA